MDFELVADAVDGVPGPHISRDQGRVLYEHIRATRPVSCLELGTARGVSGAYIASALDANGEGTLTTVDSSTVWWESPTPGDLLERLGLAQRVTLDRSYTTYTWFLKEQIQARSDEHGNCEPLYDFCFIDGSKNWTIDGLAAVLVEKLLRPGGWLLMDDLGWTYTTLPHEQQQHYFVSLPALTEPELTEPHIRAVFELIVMQHPAFTDFRIQDNWWGWARKSPDEHRRLSLESTRSIRSIVVDGLTWTRRQVELAIRRRSQP
jgi:predicted O-methyltransferase YrrM